MIGLDGLPVTLELPQEEPFLALGHAWSAMPYEVVLSQDFNGLLVATVYYTGVPVRIGIGETDNFKWRWEWSPVWMPAIDTHPQVLVDFCSWLGEIGEDAEQAFLNTPMTMKDADDALEHCDGHPTVAFELAVERLAVAEYDRRTMPGNPTRQLQVEIVPESRRVD